MRLRLFRLLITGLALTASGSTVAQSFLEPVRPVLKQDTSRALVIFGANGGTDFGDVSSITGAATYAPRGRFGLYFAGGGILGDLQGFRLAAGAAATLVPQGGNLQTPIVQLHGGVGFASYEVSLDTVVGSPAGSGLDIRRFDFPLALGFYWTLPAPQFTIHPWISPRAHIRVYDIDMLESESMIGFGTSSGLQIHLHSGLGAHLGVDFLLIEDVSGETQTGFEFVAGVFYLINLN